MVLVPESKLKHVSGGVRASALLVGSKFKVMGDKLSSVISIKLDVILVVAFKVLVNG